MFPLHLLLSPNSTMLEVPYFPANMSSQPATARVSESTPEPSHAQKTRRAAWALTWLPPETAIIPPVGMNVPEMGR